MNILQMSVSAGLFVIVIALIRIVALNKMPKKMFLILWGVALFRLLVPVSIPLPFNTYNFITDSLPDTIISSISSAVKNIISSDDLGIKNTGMVSDMTRIEGLPKQSGMNINPATIIWFAGVLILFIVFTVIFFKNHRELRFAMVINDNNYVNKWLAEHKHLFPIAIMQSDRIKTPVAVGIIKPRIILPKSINMNDQQLLNYVFIHEYYHIRRFDTLIKSILVFALCVHWFNPAIWLMFLLVNRDLELTCDEMVICHFGAETKTAYAYTLISMAEQGGRFASLYNGFSRNATEERIISIMKYKKSKFLALMLSILIAIGTIPVLASGTIPANVDILDESEKEEHIIHDYLCGHNPEDYDVYIYSNEKELIAAELLNEFLINMPADIINSNPRACSHPVVTSMCEGYHAQSYICTIRVCARANAKCLSCNQTIIISVEESNGNVHSFTSWIYKETVVLGVKMYKVYERSCTNTTQYGTCTVKETKMEYIGDIYK